MSVRHSVCVCVWCMDDFQAMYMGRVQCFHFRSGVCVWEFFSFVYYIDILPSIISFLLLFRFIHKPPPRIADSSWRFVSLFLLRIHFNFRSGLGSDSKPPLYFNIGRKGCPKLYCQTPNHSFSSTPPHPIGCTILLPLSTGHSKKNPGCTYHHSVLMLMFILSLLRPFARICNFVFAILFAYPNCFFEGWCVKNVLWRNAQIFCGCSKRRPSGCSENSSSMFCLQKVS